MNLHPVELFSLCLTPVVLASCIIVMATYTGSSFNVLTTTPFRRISATQLLIIGVSFGFLGKLLDNAYWTIPWMCKFFDSPNRWFWFENGIIANVHFRQGITIVSAIFHVLAAYKFSDIKDSLIPSFIASAVIASVAYMIFVYIFIIHPSISP